MKKFLAMLLVLGMASMANAAVSFSISGGGDVDLGDSSSVLGIELDAGNLEGYDMSIRIAGSSTAAAVLVSGAETYTPFPAPASPPAPPYTVGGAVTPTDIRYSAATIKLFGGQPIAAPATLVGNIGLDITGGQDGQVVDLELFTYAGGTRDWDDAPGVNLPEGVLATARVNVIPEPMTLTLLGLGGLAVLRRRS
jgi:hypothetical protein